MNNIIKKIALCFFQGVGLAEIGSLYFRWTQLNNPEIVNYFLIIWGVYSVLWVLTTFFAWKWLLANQTFLALFTASGVAMTGAFVYAMMNVIFV